MAKDTIKTSHSYRPDVLAILDAIAEEKGISRSEALEHLIVYHGMCGGEFPVTTRIKNMPEKEKSAVHAQILKNYKAGKFIKPQSYKLWVKETWSSDDAVTQGSAAELLLKKLMEEGEK